jgi:serine/arginine repetitive matrix protein 2
MWSRITGKSDSGSTASNRDRDDESRRRRTSESTRSKRDRDAEMRSVVSSTTTRKPSQRDTAPSSIASFTTAFDDMPRARANDDLYEDPQEERYTIRRREERPTSYAESSPSTSRRDRSRSKERDEKDRKKRGDKDKDRKSEKRRSTRSDRSGRSDIVDSPVVSRSFSGQIATQGFSQFPGQAGAPIMSGALPPSSQQAAGGMSSHVQAQFPGQDPAQYASSALPGGNPFGAAAEFYNDTGESVHQQPGVRPQPPSVIIGQDTPHLMAAAAQPQPVADTGAGTAADFYGGTSNAPSKPPRPSTMPGTFDEDDFAPQKPSRPSSKPGKVGSAATLAGGAALGYAMGHSSSNSHQTSNNHQSTSYTNNNSGPSASMYYQGGNPSTAATNGSSHMPSYSHTFNGAPPPKPPRPGKPEKQSSSSNAGLYAAGAAGVAAYALHEHNSHNHSQNYSSSIAGASQGQNNNGINPSSSPFMGGMTQRHQHTGPVSRFVDWWKDYEDIQRMEEYTEYIGVCKGCFDPRSSVMDAPRKHHYHRKRSSEFMRPSGGIEKQSRYSLKEKKSHSSFSSGDERRRKTSNNAAGWVAAGLGGIGLAKVGQAVLGTNHNDLDDTYSIKSGRNSRSRISRHSRSRSGDRKSYTYGRSEIRQRSRSRDRKTHMSVGVTMENKNGNFVRRRSRSRSRSSSGSRDGKLGLGTAVGVGLAGAALGSALSKKRQSRSRSKSPKKAAFVHHRRDSSADERRRRRSQQLRRKSSRSSASGASVIDISQSHQSQGGFLGGFFAAPAPKQKRLDLSSTSHRKKKKGFFTFGNASSSSSDTDIAFGTGYVRRKGRSSPKRRNSDERLKASLVGLGAAAAEIQLAKAGRSAGKHQSEVIAVKENRNRRKSNNYSRPASRYGDEEWEDLPDDDTSDSASHAGLVYGDYDWRKGKSQESLASNGSGTSKWGWRWGFGKKKRRSSDVLHDNIASNSLVNSALIGATGAVTSAAISSKLGRHDSESSSVHTLQTVYPVASNDPTNFDARQTSSVPTPQPFVTSVPGAMSIQQPQPLYQVPGAIYSTQAPSQTNYVAPAGPPVFSQVPGQPAYPLQYQTQNVIIQASQQPSHPTSLRRTNSSPIQTSSWKRDAAAGLAVTAGAAAIIAAKGRDRPPSTSSNVRFDLTNERTAKDERERRRAQDRQDEEDQRSREQQKRDQDVRRDEEHRQRLEQQRRDDEERRRQQLYREEQDRQAEQERRHRELIRQQEEARKYRESERLATLEAQRIAEEQRRRQDEARALEVREAHEREVRAEAQRRLDLEAEHMRKERHEAERREAERAEVSRRESRTREAAEQQQREREAHISADRYVVDQPRPNPDKQRIGSSISSVAFDVRKENKHDDRERDVIQPSTWKSTAASAIAAGTVAAIASEAIASSKEKGKYKEDREDRDQERTRRREASSTARVVEPSTSNIYEPSKVRTYEPSSIKTVEPSSVVTFAPSNIQQDYADDDIFDRDLFKKPEKKQIKQEQKQTARDVLQDWEDRYNEKPVTQADFFAPKELLQNDQLPKVRPIDPNEGATDLHTFEAHGDFGPTHAMVPPYPASYSFTATRDGRSAPQEPWPVPSLNLILPTPPGSRAPSVRSVSVPPSPNVEPIKELEEPEELPKQEESNRARARVSWGENQFHHFDVHTPDIQREQFVSDSDFNDKNKKASNGDGAVERDLQNSPQQLTRLEKTFKDSDAPEIAASTQYLRDEKDSDWDNIVNAASKKSIKKKEKKARAVAASVETPSRDDWDELKRYNESVVSNPFSDSHAAPSTIAPSTVAFSVPSSSSVYQSHSSQSASDLGLRAGLGTPIHSPGFVEGEVTAEFASMHVPGSFDETPAAEEVTDPVAEAWDKSIDRGEKGKRQFQSTKDVTLAQYPLERAGQNPVLDAEPVTDLASDASVTVSKKAKKKKTKAAKRSSVESWEESDISPSASPTMERDIRDIEPSRTAAAAAMASGFSALVGAAKKQDQDRMASDFEHAQQNFHLAKNHSDRDVPVLPHNDTQLPDDRDKTVSMSGATLDDEEGADIMTPKRKKDKRRSSGRFSPTIGSPLRTETKYDDYIGASTKSAAFEVQSIVKAPKVPTEAALITSPKLSMSRDIHDSGYYAPEDRQPVQPPDRDSDEFFSASSDEMQRSKGKSRGTIKNGELSSNLQSRHDENVSQPITPPRSQHHDEDTHSVHSRSKYEDDPDREERHRQRREAKSEEREQSRDRGSEFGDRGERKRRHRHRDNDEPVESGDAPATVSETHSEANGERRRRHKRREGDRDGSPETDDRRRSSAASEPYDVNNDHKSPGRKSKRGDDDSVSVASSPAPNQEDYSPRKEKRSNGLFGLFSRSKENLEETSSKLSKSKEDDDEDSKRRRRKHRSDRGSMHGSDDDDTRSTISSGSRREKRSSRSERGDGDRRDSYDDKVHRSSYTR